MKTGKHNRENQSPSVGFEMINKVYKHLKRLIFKKKGR